MKTRYDIQGHLTLEELRGETGIRLMNVNMWLVFSLMPGLLWVFVYFLATSFVRVWPSVTLQPAHPFTKRHLSCDFFHYNSFFLDLRVRSRLEAMAVVLPRGVNRSMVRFSEFVMEKFAMEHSNGYVFLEQYVRGEGATQPGTFMTEVMR